jgi:hypothetical protein
VVRISGNPNSAAAQAHRIAIPAPAGGHWGKHAFGPLDRLGEPLRNEFQKGRTVTDPISSTAAVAATNGAAHAGAEALPTNAHPSDVAAFRSLVEGPDATSAAGLGDRMVDAGVGLSRRYSERIDAARELAAVSADDLGLDHGDYMRAMFSVQVALNEVTVELQSTSQIANSVKDSFNGLYRMQG